MPGQDFIDVRILVNGLPLPEYAHPDGDDDSHSHTQTRYIEVTTGQKFEVQVNWRAGFNIYHAPYLRSELRLDNSELRTKHHTKVENIELNANLIVADKIDNFRSRKLFDNTVGAWKEAYFTFGALDIVDEDYEKIAVSPEAVSRLGVVQVICDRSKKVSRAFPSISTARDDTLNRIHEKALKGKQLKNIVQYEYGSITSAPEARLHKYDRLDGVASTQYTFRFLYRSRKILQSIGCIPRSPSPPPDLQLMLARTEAMLKISKQRERDANLRFLRSQEKMRRSNAGERLSEVIDLEDEPTTPVRHQEHNIKAEEDDTSKTPVQTTSEPHIDNTLSKNNNMKRERDDEDDIVEMQQPPKQPKITIDLTDDD